MSKGVSQALLKGRRGISIDRSVASVADIIRNEAGLQGLSLTTVAMLSGIDRQRFHGMLAGLIGVSERELLRIEDALGMKIDRTRLTPIKYLMSKNSSQLAKEKEG